MVVLGGLGWVLARYGIKPSPIVLGLILGSMSEENMRLALLISQGDWTVFFTRPISLTIAILTAVVLLFPVVRTIRDRRREAREAATA
jgi:putative tricarboxylic transport membrane protein